MAHNDHFMGNDAQLDAQEGATSVAHMHDDMVDICEVLLDKTSDAVVVGDSLIVAVCIMVVGH